MLFDCGSEVIGFWGRVLCAVVYVVGCGLGGFGCCIVVLVELLGEIL